ncbi:hypothetical protein PITC_090640 [Penicillium italicum]|uniref:Uncharacterized protein n=1 Tax=Penicillium italicum TaxID=40296 RepID=A0A0A2LJU0_PENIT|nr:hypothetical protein PITC_090640 [Penicillium italicum]
MKSHQSYRWHFNARIVDLQTRPRGGVDYLKIQTRSSPIFRLRLIVGSIGMGPKT